MTLRKLMQAAGEYPAVFIALFVVLPLATWLLRLLHGKDQGGTSPWKYLYSALVYLACIPGVCSVVVTAYLLFFTEENLMDYDVTVYFLPGLSMVATLILIRKAVSFDLVPGFDRLSGLMVMIACSFGLALAIQKTRIWIFAGLSFVNLMLVAAGIFGLLKWGAYMLFRRADEPKEKPPGLPGLQ